MDLIRKVDYNHERKMDMIYKNEKKGIQEKMKQFKLVKRYDNFDLYEHKTLGYKECFK